MGTLTQGFGGSAQGAANDSFQWSKVGLGLDTTSAVAGGIGGYELANYQAAVAKNNAAIARQNAAADISSGLYAESAQKEKTGQIVGEERAGQGASGVDVNIGSPVAVRNTTKDIGAMDAAMIHFNAARAAYGDQVQAIADSASAKMLQQAAIGSLLGGIAKGGATFLGGASSLEGRYAQWQLENA